MGLGRVGRPRYIDLIEWIDSLPADREFTLKDGQEAAKLSNQAVRSVVLFLVRQRRLRQTILSLKVRTYCKTAAWDAKKAVEENYARLKAKSAAYKTRNSK